MSAEKLKKCPGMACVCVCVCLCVCVRERERERVREVWFKHECWEKFKKCPEFALCECVLVGMFVCVCVCVSEREREVFYLDMSAKRLKKVPINCVETDHIMSPWKKNLQFCARRIWSRKLAEYKKTFFVENLFW